MPDPTDAAVVAALRVAKHYRDRARAIESKAAYERDDIKRLGTLNVAIDANNLGHAFERFAQEMQKAVTAELEEAAK